MSQNFFKPGSTIAIQASPVENPGNVNLGAQIIQASDGYQAYLYQPVNLGGGGGDDGSTNGQLLRSLLIPLNTGILIEVPQNLLIGGISGVGGTNNVMVASDKVPILQSSSTRSINQLVDPMNRPIVYVNPKQYHRILKRRVARAKLEADGRIPKDRRQYLHESRHKHAQNRVRGPGGKFQLVSLPPGGHDDVTVKEENEEDVDS